MTSIGSFQVSVQTLQSGRRLALLAPAAEEDMPTDWTFSWQQLWQKTDADCQNIIKLVGNQQWGLIRYGLYPYPGEPEFLEIEHLETNPTSRGQLPYRLIEPVGKWLLWYSIQVGLQFCSGGISDTPILLVSLEEAFTYYRDIVQMQYVGATTIAPGEDGYVFSFSRTGATAFCLRQEKEWGIPTRVNPRTSQSGD